MALAAGWGIAVAGLGAWLTDLTPWYYALRKPPWQPPDWLFGPAWSLILGCASFAAYYGWTNAPTPDTAWLVAALFVFNGAANMFWSQLFFRRRRPDWSLVESAFLWLSVAALVGVLWTLSQPASLLMVPYLLWVSFAIMLNRDIVRRNQPFGMEPAWRA